MEIRRKSGRAAGDLREIRVQKGYLKHALGSCLFEMGDTKVLCAVTMTDRVPPFMVGRGTGWVTAEYGLLPASANDRTPRNSFTGGRSQEIQRLIGRSLRGIVDMKKLKERTLWIDCDVIQADGGTRTASVNGAFIALVEALDKMRNAGMITVPVLRDYIAAVSVGVVQGDVLLDLDYSEDSAASVDFNVVMTGKGSFVEVQGTGEGVPFSRDELDALLESAGQGVNKIVEIQKGLLADEIVRLLGN